MNNKTNELNQIKQNILDIKKISKRSNISSKELKLLFQENNLKIETGCLYLRRIN